MTYTDENIIKAKNAYKAQTYGDINSGIYMKEEYIEFHKTTLFQNSISVMLPKSFTDMSLAQAKIKYPMEQRPQIIKTNERTDVNFTFSLLEQELSNEQVEELNNYLCKILKQTQPTNKYFEKKIEQVGAICVGWFDFQSSGIDEKLYHFMYCTPVKGKILQGIFNCPMRLSPMWKPVVLQVIHTIEDLTTEKDGGKDARV